MPSTVLWLLTVALASRSAVQQAEPLPALAKEERVYFAANGNPFRGYYATDGWYGFRSTKDTIQDLLRPWMVALKNGKVFPGLAKESRSVQVEITNAEVPQEELGAQAFTTSGDAALVWSSPKIQLRRLSLEPAELTALDRQIIEHEAVARALEFRVAVEQPGEGNPNPPRLLDPSRPGNLRVSAFTPVRGSSIVFVKVELFVEPNRSNRQKQPLDDSLLLLYSKQFHKIEGRITIVYPDYWFFQVRGDPHVYLIYNAGCVECDGTTIIAVGWLDPQRRARDDLVFVDTTNTMSVWTY